MKKRIFFIIASILVLNWPFISAYTLEGTVYDYNDEAIEDVLIKVTDGYHNTLGRDYSDQSGLYRIFGLPEGIFTLEAKKHGMTTFQKEIRITGSSKNETLYEDIRFSESNFQFNVKSSQLMHLYLPTDYKIPANAFSAYQKGMKAFKKVKFKKSSKLFRKAIECDPSFSRAYTQLALSLSEMDEGENEIVSLFEKAIETNINDPFPYMHLGKLHITEKNYDQAIIMLNKAVDIDSNLAEANLLLGKAFYSKGKFSKAEFYLTQGILINPEIAKNYRLTLANMYVQQERYTDARDQFTQYLKENPYSKKHREIKQLIEDLENRIAIYKMKAME